MSDHPKYWTTCSHCHATTASGTHDGCLQCRKVKATKDGRRPKKKE